MSDERETVPCWKMPGRSNRFHLFIGGRSLCLKWGFLNGDPMSPWTGGERGPEDCAECHKRATKHYPVSKEQPK